MRGSEVVSGVDAGLALTTLAEAVVARDVSAITAARTQVLNELGEAAMVDAVAVIANFQRMVRIADSTGIPLDEPMLMMTQGIRSELGIDEYKAAANTPSLPLGKRLLGRVLGPFAPKILRKIAASRQGVSS